jgi:replicative DNA helicase
MIEKTLLGHLLYNESYARKVIPYLKEDYFADRSSKVIYDLIDSHVKRYNTVPVIEALEIELESHGDLSEDFYKEVETELHSLSADLSVDQDWLVDQTEKFCQDKAIYNAIMKSIGILDGKSKESLGKGAIPTLLSEALAVSFDSSIGHDFLDDFEKRYDFYHQEETRIPFDLDYMNRITKGGLPNKSLSVILAGTGVGKSLFMCHTAAAALAAGKNVLYITMEMAEERIAERIDANLLNVPVNELCRLSREEYGRKVSKLKERVKGKLIIKEYPTSSAGSANFRHLINELKIKRNFVPDIIMIDYLNICCSSKIRNTTGVNSYTYIKTVAEELRALAVEFDVPILTATQTTRSGYNSSDVEITDVSESFGVSHTVDFMFSLTTSDELDQLNQLMVKQLKNRYGDPNLFRKFVIGVDRTKMKLYDTEQHSQEDLVDDTPVMDNSKFGERAALYKPERQDIFGKFK